jgi:hypothetical protein
VKIAADLAAKELEETAKKKKRMIHYWLIRLLIGSISWILDLIRLENELEVEKIGNLHYGG